MRKQRALSGTKQMRQKEQEERRENRDVRSGDHQRVEGAGVAVVLGPHALQLVVLADEDRLHHAGLVGVAGVEARDAGERGRRADP